MPPPLDSSQVGEKLTEFSSNPHTILFAGAGVGSRVGLPAWGGLLESISTLLDARDLEAEASLVRKRITNGDFLGAATIIRTCEELIQSERYSLFSDPFSDLKVSDEEIEKLEAFVRFPSAGIVTTNYDRSLLRACSKYRSTQLPIPIELNDESMRGAATRSEFILARIHGRVEIPHSMQIASEDYQLLSKNQYYIDFISRLLEFRNVLFVGFSFVDPAIRMILGIYRDAFGPSFPTRHAALVPSDASNSDLLRLLRSVNIEPWIYDADNRHHALWDGFREHYEASARKLPELGLPTVDQTLSSLPESELHRFLAFAYAQSTQTSSKDSSLSDLVRESVVLSTIAEESGGTSQKITVEHKLKNRLKLTSAEAETLVTGSLARLTFQRQVTVTNSGLIQLIGKPINDASKFLIELSKTVTSRLRIVYDIEISEAEAEKLPDLLEEIFLARAWDIGAFYSGATTRPNETSVLAICNRLGANHFPLASTRWLNSLGNAVRDLFANPPKTDAAKLAKLGRAAFAVQLAFASPRSTMFQQCVLPDILYFDASIILPAIVDGHPLQRGYQSAVFRLIEANRRHGTDTPRHVGSYFLDEILSHRKKAIIIVEELGLQKNERLEMYVSFQGASNVNVFISGFSASRSNKKYRDESFQDFLGRIAPYSTHDSLKSFLGAKFSIQIATSDYRNERVSDYNVVFNDLKLGYELSHREPKSDVLIHHEAEQMVALTLDLRKGKRPLFVTADASLRKIVSSAKRINSLSGSIVSEVGLIGMIDLLVGLKPDSQVYTRLLWGMPSRTSEQQIRDFLISRSISSYNEGLLVQMPDLLKRVVSQHHDEITRIGNLTAKEVGEAKEVLEFVDRIETEYLNAYDERIQEVRKQFGSGAI